MATSVSSVTSHFPKPQPGFTTTTSGAVSSGATTVGLNSTGNYSDGDIVALVIDPTDASKKQVLVGTIDTGGVQVTGVVWADGTNQSHASGATVVDMVTATHLQMMTKGMLVQHKQDGTHADTITTNAINENSVGNGVAVDGLNIKDGKLNTNNSVVTANITDDSVTPAKLTSGAGSSWAWQSWTPSWTNLTIGSATVVAKYIQTGKTVKCRLSVVFAANTSISGSVSFSLPITAAAHTALQHLGMVSLNDATGNVSPASIVYTTTTTATIFVHNAGSTYAVYSALSSTVPFTWTTSDGILGEFEYEAA